MISGKKKGGLWGVLGGKEVRVGVILGKKKGWVMVGIGRERRKGGLWRVLGGKEERVGVILGKKKEWVKGGLRVG